MIHRVLFSYCLGMVTGGYAVTRMIAHAPDTNLAWGTFDSIVVSAIILSWLFSALAGIYYTGRHDEHEAAAPEQE